MTSTAVSERLQADFNRAGNSLQLLAEEIGSALTPALRSAAQGVASFADSIRELISGDEQDQLEEFRETLSRIAEGLDRQGFVEAGNTVRQTINDLTEGNISYEEAQRRANRANEEVEQTLSRLATAQGRLLALQNQRSEINFDRLPGDAPFSLEEVQRRIDVQRDTLSELEAREQESADRRREIQRRSNQEARELEEELRLLTRRQRDPTTADPSTDVVLAVDQRRNLLEIENDLARAQDARDAASRASARNLEEQSAAVRQLNEAQAENFREVARGAAQDALDRTRLITNNDQRIESFKQVGEAIKDNNREAVRSATLENSLVQETIRAAQSGTRNLIALGRQELEARKRFLNQQIQDRRSTASEILRIEEQLASDIVETQRDIESERRTLQEQANDLQRQRLTGPRAETRREDSAIVEIQQLNREQREIVAQARDIEDRARSASDVAELEQLSRERDALRQESDSITQRQRQLLSNIQGEGQLFFQTRNIQRERDGFFEALQSIEQAQLESAERLQENSTAGLEPLEETIEAINLAIRELARESSDIQIRFDTEAAQREVNRLLDEVERLRGDAERPVRIEIIPVVRETRTGRPVPRGRFGSDETPEQRQRREEQEQIAEAARVQQETNVTRLRSRLSRSPAARAAAARELAENEEAVDDYEARVEEATRIRDQRINVNSDEAGIRNHEQRVNQATQPKTQNINLESEIVNPEQLEDIEEIVPGIIDAIELAAELPVGELRRLVEEGQLSFARLAELLPAGLQEVQSRLRAEELIASVLIEVDQNSANEAEEQANEAARDRTSGVNQRTNRATTQQTNRDLNRSARSRDSTVTQSADQASTQETDETLNNTGRDRNSNFIPQVDQQRNQQANETLNNTARDREAVIRERVQRDRPRNQDIQPSSFAPSQRLLDTSSEVALTRIQNLQRSIENRNIDIQAQQTVERTFDEFREILQRNDVTELRADPTPLLNAIRRGRDALEDQAFRLEIDVDSLDAALRQIAQLEGTVVINPSINRSNQEAAEAGLNQTARDRDAQYNPAINETEKERVEFELREIERIRTAETTLPQDESQIPRLRPNTDGRGGRDNVGGPRFAPFQLSQESLDVQLGVLRDVLRRRPLEARAQFVITETLDDVRQQLNDNPVELRNDPAPLLESIEEARERIRELEFNLEISPEQAALAQRQLDRIEAQLPIRPRVDGVATRDAINEVEDALERDRELTVNAQLEVLEDNVREANEELNQGIDDQVNTALGAEVNQESVDQAVQQARESAEGQTINIPATVTPAETPEGQPAQEAVEAGEAGQANLTVQPVLQEGGVAAVRNQAQGELDASPNALNVRATVDSLVADFDFINAAVSQFVVSAANNNPIDMQVSLDSFSEALSQAEIQIASIQGRVPVEVTDRFSSVLNNLRARLNSLERGINVPIRASTSGFGNIPGNNQGGFLNGGGFLPGPISSPNKDTALFAGNRCESLWFNGTLPLQRLSTSCIP